MEVKPQEIWQLNQKIDQLYGIVRQLGHRIGWDGIEDLCFTVQSSSNDFELVNDFTARQQDFELHSQTREDKMIFTEESVVNNSTAFQEEDIMEQNDSHKDILADEQEQTPRRFPITANNNDDISCEDQVQRLTAQLTAAYHRIASLEDQLLANRDLRETRNNIFYGNH